MSDQEGHSASRFSHWKWLAALACVLPLVFGLWLFARSRPGVAAPANSAKAHLQVDPRLSTLPSDAVAGPRTKLTTSAKGGAVDLCGIGKVTVDEKDPAAISQYIEGLTKKAQTRWLSALLNSDNLRARAAGLYLEDAFDERERDPVAAQEARDELVQLAVGASDPFVYALAVYQCLRRVSDSNSGACRQVSWNGWARLEPDNAAPWFAIASEARASNSAAAELDAFNHAAAAHTFDEYNHSLYTFAEPELPENTTPLERAFLAEQVIAVEAATASPPYAGVFRHCSADAMQDAHVKQQCSAIAELLIGKSNTVIGLAIGEAFGKRAGWPAARIDALEQEKNAFLQSDMLFVPIDDPAPWGCVSVGRLNDYFTDRIRLGELAAMRELRERSGESIDELARKHAEFMEKTRRAAQEQAPEAPPN